MDISVLIPSYGRPDKLRALLASLATQRLDGLTYEVRVGLDGGDAATAEAVMGSLPMHARQRFTIVPMKRCGQATVRNALLHEASGELILWLNDDVVASPGLLLAHHGAHAEAASAGVKVMVVGAADWRVHADDTVFDRLIRETSMVFFYDVMDDPAQGDTSRRDWGFRHAWTINLSMRADDVRTAGAFRIFEAWYGSEDIELGYRVAGLPGGRAVWYRRRAQVEHDHRVGLVEYIEREYKLGYNAFHFARECPEAAAATYRRDIASREEIEYCRAFVARELAAAKRSRKHVAAAGVAAAGSPSDWPVLRESLYLAHLPLKRWSWRLGLLDAAEARPLEASQAVDQSA